MVIGVTTSGISLVIVLIGGIPAKLGELLIPRFRVDNSSRNGLRSPVRLDEVELIVLITLGIRGGNPEPYT